MAFVVLHKHIGNSTPPSLFTFLGITPINIVDFDGKEVLIWPSVANKGKGKEVIIGNARKVDENNKNPCRKVVAERTPDRGETLKVTITTSNAGGSGT
jgi:hypothetical protein